MKSQWSWCLVSSRHHLVFLAAEMNMKLVGVDEILNEVFKRPTLLGTVTPSLVVLSISVGVPRGWVFLHCEFPNWPNRSDHPISIKIVKCGIITQTDGCEHFFLLLLSPWSLVQGLIIIGILDYPSNEVGQPLQYLINCSKFIFAYHWYGYSSRSRTRRSNSVENAPWILLTTWENQLIRPHDTWLDSRWIRSGRKV